MSNEEVIQEIEDEIKKAQGEPEEFQIEITEDPAEEAKDVADEAVEKKEDPEYGEKVQKRSSGSANTGAERPAIRKTCATRARLQEKF